MYKCINIKYIRCIFIMGMYYPFKKPSSEKERPYNGIVQSDNNISLSRTCEILFKSDYN